jgi:hypothetical protein
METQEPLMYEMLTSDVVNVTQSHFERAIRRCWESFAAYCPLLGDMVHS